MELLQNKYIYFDSEEDLRRYVYEMTLTIGVNRNYKLNLSINASQLEVHVMVSKNDIWILNNICKN